MTFTCKICGALASAPGQVCNPCADEDTCSFCGRPRIDSLHVCSDKRGAMKYVCEGCGRFGMEMEHLCKPKIIA